MICNRKSVAAWLVACGGLSVIACGDEAIEVESQTSALRGRRPSFVQFDDCNEIAGVTTGPTAEIRPLVPAQFTVVEASPGEALLVFRVAQCQAVSVDGSRPRPGIVAQVGPSIVPPTGTGDINNYAIQYATNDRRLAAALRRNGFSAQLIPRLEYQLVPTGPGTFDLSIVQPRRKNGYVIAGPVIDPAASDPGAPFVANWWTGRPGGRRAVTHTPFPNIAFGDASGAQVSAAPGSQVARLLGATSKGFSVLALRGVFSTAPMEIKTVPAPKY